MNVEELDKKIEEQRTKKDKIESMLEALDEARKTLIEVDEIVNQLDEDGIYKLDIASDIKKKETRKYIKSGNYKKNKLLGVKKKETRSYIKSGKYKKVSKQVGRPQSIYWTEGKKQFLLNYGAKEAAKRYGIGRTMCYEKLKELRGPRMSEEHRKKIGKGVKKAHRQKIKINTSYMR